MESTANEIILKGTTEDNLLDKIKTVVREVLTETKEEPSEPENELLTVAETSQLLKIDRTTLWKWTKDGKLKRYGIGNRVYYKKSEVLESIISLK